MKITSLNTALFWDADINAIDWQVNANAIIVRVLERGSLEDFKQTKIFYGDEKIKQAAIQSRSLSKKTLHFVAAIFNIPLTEFRCYKNTLFPELHWMY